MSHQCHAVGCREEIPPRLHMCPKHWRMVPGAVQQLLWKHYRPGQEVDKQPSVEYIATAFVSISCVALQEGRTPPRIVGRGRSWCGRRNRRFGLLHIGSQVKK